MTAGTLQDKNYSLAWQLSHDSNSLLIPLVKLSHQNALFCKKMTFHIPHLSYYKYSYTHEMLRASRENFERETLEKNKIDSSTILDIWFSKFLYFHPLHWHILERFISQILISPYPYLWGDYLVLGKQFRDDQYTWLMQWAYCGIWKAKEDKVQRNLVRARSLEGLGVLGRLGLEGLLLFMYPNWFSSESFTA